MSKRSRSTRAIAVLVPAILLILAVGVGGWQQQQTSPDLFQPVYQIYQYIQSYFYQPNAMTDQEALYGAMKGVVEQLNDPYSEFLDPEDRQRFDDSLDGQFSGVGIEITLIDGILSVITPLVGTPAEAAGVLSGDQILAIDGESTEGITLTQAALRIRGETGSPVVLTIRHEDGEIEEIEIIRATIILNPVNSELMGSDDIAYIQITRFEEDTTLELDRALNGFDLDNLTGIILDLRSNPGGLMPEAISVSSRFIDDGVVVQTSDRLSEGKKYWSRGNRVPNLPLAILINRGSASASEITAGAIRDNEMGILIGQQSFGKGVFQQMINFPDGSALKITAGEYFPPSGRTVNGVGLTPDIVVEDEQDPVDVAIEWIRAHAGIEMPIDLDGELAQTTDAP